MPDRPVPHPDPQTAPYWDAAREHRFVLPRCNACARFHFYPRSVCPHCGSPDLAWTEASGRGKVYSYSVVHRAPSPGFAADVPYVVAMVEVDEGPHLMTNLVNCVPEAAKVGMPVRVAFREAGEGAVLPVFEPARG